MTEEEKFKRLARRVKIRRWLMMIGIALAIFLLLTGIGLQLVLKSTKRASAANNAYLDVVDTMLSPNIKVSDQYLGNTTIMGGQVISHRYKEVEGQRVAWSPVTADYSWLRGANIPNALNSTDEGNHAMYDRMTQQRVPRFYNLRHSVSHADEQITQDLKQVDKSRGQVAEVALTFKEPLTYRQIQQRLPQGVHAVWYWAGIAGTASGTHMDNDYVGVQATKTTGQLTNSDYQLFRQATRRAKKSDYQMEFDGFEVFKYGSQYAKTYPRLSDAKFAGVIATGTSVNFKRLGQPRWIAASSVGYFQAEKVFK